jgi:hypothetical protein
MGERIYERPFSVVTTKDLPPPRATTTPLGRHWNGCRVGFDLGASDRKAAAVVDGKAVFSEETIWNPVPQSDPQWHFDQIMDSLERAAEHLPRVDAIGGSAAGVYVNNHVRVASLFRGVPAEVFKTRVNTLFLELKRAWDGIPFEVVNDGEVTALAGSMALGQNAVLGIAMGSSLAGGFVTPEGNITSWLNELAFVPVDYNSSAPVDEWSGDRGCGAAVFFATMPRTLDAGGGHRNARRNAVAGEIEICADVDGTRRRAGGEDLSKHRRLLRLRPLRTSPSSTISNTSWLWGASPQGLAGT